MDTIELKPQYKANNELKILLKLLAESMVDAKRIKDKNGEFGNALAYGKLAGTIDGILGFFTL